MYAVNDVISEGQRLSNVFSFRDKALHARYSRPIKGLWTTSKVLELESFLDESIEAFIDKLDRDFVGAEHGPRICMMEDWLTYFAWDAAANFTFGRPYGFIKQGQDIKGMIRESRDSTSYFAAIGQIPWLDHWLSKNPIVPLVSTGILWSFAAAAEIYNEYCNTLSTNTPRHGKESFIDKYYRLKDMHPDVVGDQQVVHYLVLNVAAGGDPVAGALRAIVYHLAKCPSASARLAEELDAANLSFPAQWKDANKLEYLDAVVYESSRLTPAIGLMFERIVPSQGLELPDGRHIPGGTQVGINPCVVSHDVGVFGDDVEVFNPGRWLQRPDEDDQGFAARQQHMRETADFMFGAGSRVCMGKVMAKMEMYKLTATLYSMFHIRLTDQAHEWTYRNSWFMFHENIPMVISRRARN